MRTLASIIALFFVTLALSGCGGDSGCGRVTGGASTTGSTASSCSGTTTNPGGGGTSTVTVTTLTVTSSAASIPTDGSTTAKITVLAKDANNNAISGAAVTVAASAGTLSGAAATTAADGTITATLSGAGVAAGQAITVTATSGSVSNKATVNVVANQQTITLLASLPQMPSANAKPVTITAILQGASNQLLAGVPVTFQVSSGAIAPVQTTAGAASSPAVAAGTTDANGVAAATLSTPGNPANRTITVTATAGSTSATVQVQVINTNLSISGPGTLVQGTQGTYSITLVDSGGTGIGNQTVTLASALGNTLSASTVTTDPTGAATFNVTATKSGADTITGTGEGASGNQQITVSNQKFSITAPVATTPPAAPTSIHVNTVQLVTVSWADANGPVSTGTVLFTTSRGTLSGQSSGISGGALTTPISISSTTAGPATISATAVDGTGATVATAQVVVNFVATTPQSVALQASPSTVTLQGSSTLTASVTDPTGNPVANVSVGFTLTDATGGQLSAASATTNPQGQASVTYKASTISSAPNGVTVTAQVQNTAITGTTTLTVGGQTVSLSLGTGNTISPYSSTQYSAPYTVQAVDAAGNGVSNVNVVFSVKSVAYAMGHDEYHTPPGSWLLPIYSQTTVSTNGFVGFCPAAQVQEYNGIINPTPPPANVTPVPTDIPGSVVSTDVGQATTGTGGTATVNLIYPKDHAYWVEVALTATATVSGTQNSTTANFILLGLAADYTTQTVIPPGQISPYGEGTACY